MSHAGQLLPCKVAMEPALAHAQGCTLASTRKKVLCPRRRARTSRVVTALEPRLGALSQSGGISTCAPRRNLNLACAPARVPRPRGAAVSYRRRCLESMPGPRRYSCTSPFTLRRVFLHPQAWYLSYLSYLGWRIPHEQSRFRRRRLRRLGCGTLFSPYIPTTFPAPPARFAPRTSPHRCSYPNAVRGVREPASPCAGLPRLSRRRRRRRIAALVAVVH